MNVRKLVYHDHGTTIWWQGWASPFPGQRKSQRFPPQTCCLRKPISVSRGWDRKVSREKSKEVSLKRHEPREYDGNPEGHSLRVSGQEGSPNSRKTSHVGEKARREEEGEEREE